MNNETQTTDSLAPYAFCPRAGDAFGAPGDWTRDVYSDELFTCPQCGLTFPMTAGVTRHPSGDGVVLLHQAAREAGWSPLAEARVRGVRAVLEVRGRAIDLARQTGRRGFVL